MQYVYNVSVVCCLIKTSIFSQEIFHKKCIPEGSQEENDALILGSKKEPRCTRVKLQFLFGGEGSLDGGEGSLNCK